MSEQHVSYLNVYFDPKTGKNRTLFLRADPAWERQAVKDNWWQMGHLIPIYVIRIKWKQEYIDHVEKRAA